MNLSILPIFVILVFGFSLLITVRAKRVGSINRAEARSVYTLLLAFAAWSIVVIVLGVNGIHVALMASVPMLWHAGVMVTMVMIGLVASGNLRPALRGIARSTPVLWLVLVQALRIGALGGVIKGIQGEVTSTFVFWVGIPDFLFGISALIVAFLLLRQAVSDEFLVVWSLVGASVILLPTFLANNYWMNEPGFSFIFEFPMVMAPGIVVPVFVLLNFLLAWGAWIQSRSGEGGDPAIAKG